MLSREHMRFVTRLHRLYLHLLGSIAWHKLQSDAKAARRLQYSYRISKLYSALRLSTVICYEVIKEAIAGFRDARLTRATKNNDFDHSKAPFVTQYVYEIFENQSPSPFAFRDTQPEGQAYEDPIGRTCYPPNINLDN